MIPHLVSSKTCPFVQRAVILLLEKHVEHEVTYVDLGNKPEWFLEKSPRAKVPLLIVDGVVLFESQAILRVSRRDLGRRAPDTGRPRAASSRSSVLSVCGGGPVTTRAEPRAASGCHTR